MKKLLFFVALTSFMASHAMESTYAKATADRPEISSGNAGQVNLTSTNRPVLVRHSSENDIFVASRLMKCRHWQVKPDISSGNDGQAPQKGVIYVTAKTSLGTVSKVLSGQFIQYILHGKVNVGFNRTEKTFFGIQDGQWIKNPTDAQALFNQYKEIFNATKQKNISFSSTTMDEWN